MSLLRRARVPFTLGLVVLLAGCPEESEGGGGQSAAGTGGAAGSAGMAGMAGAGGTGGMAVVPGCELPDGAGAEPVSFRNDVLPVFGLACALGPCHGSTKEADLYLAPACKFNAATMKCEFAAPGTTPMAGQDVLTDEIVNAIHANLVDVPSGTLASAQRVKAGAPMESFLIQKVTDQQNSLGHVGCVKQFASAKGECGDAMPPVGMPLCKQAGGPELVQMIARWIKQGALNN